ncbi:MAG: PKD domain-containing protein, partial [Bacteroidia bacterium]
GGPYTSGGFKFITKIFVASGSSAYFNFQGGSVIGISWPIEFYLNDNGSYSVGSISGNYPQGKWFEIKIDIDLTNNKWEVFFNNVSQGYWSNAINSVSFLNIFDADPNTEFWIDDLSYCVNNDCNPDLSVEKLTIHTNPLCSNHKADVSVKIKNNSSIPATQMDLAIDLAGQSRISKLLNLNVLASGKDTTITLQGLFKSNLSGTGKLIKAINMSKDPVATNDTANTTITILPSPSGSAVLQGSPFQGVFRAGIITQPDLLEPGKTNTYELTAPKGYTNFNYNSAWIISAFTLKTQTGIALPSTAYNLTAPNTTLGTNGYISYKGTPNYLDSTLVFSVTVQNKSTSCDSTINRILRIVPTPKPDFRFTKPACDGTPIIFENKSSINSGTLSYVWYFGDGDSSDFETPVHVYPTYGTYCVKLVTTSLPYLIKHDTTICITISEIPKIIFKVINACEGQNVSFLNQTTIGIGSLSYDWNFGDGTTNSKLTNPTHLYSKAGGYSVNLKATSNTGCVSSLTKNANQFLRPKADFKSTGICSKNPTEFINLSTIGAGDRFGDNWQFGDGTSNNEKNPKHIYVTPGVKLVKYTAISQFGCKDSMIKNITIEAAPNASFSHGQVCNIDPVIFNNTTSEPSGILVNYIWDFGDGKTSNLKNPQHPYPDLGPRVVNLTANGSNGCSTMFTKNIKVLLQPVAGFNAVDACAGFPVIFSNKTKGGGQITYKWKFGDGDSSSLFLPTKIYATNTSATFNVSLTASILGGCRNTASMAVNIAENPKCEYTISSAGTGGYEYIFRPKVTSYPFYQWSFEGEGISNASTVVHKFQGDGKYRVRVLMKTVEGCSCLDTSQFVTINHLGVKSLEANTGITFFPNPNNGSFNLRVNSISPTEPFTFNIFDITGRIVYTSVLVGNSNHSIINENLAKGFYTLEIIKQTGQRVATKMNVIK